MSRWRGCMLHQVPVPQTGAGMSLAGPSLHLPRCSNIPGAGGIADTPIKSWRRTRSVERTGVPRRRSGGGRSVNFPQACDLRHSTEISILIASPGCTWPRPAPPPKLRPGPPFAGAPRSPSAFCVIGCRHGRSHAWPRFSSLFAKARRRSSW